MLDSIRNFFQEAGLAMISVPSLLFCMGLFVTYPLTGLIFVDIICGKDGSGVDDDCSSVDISQKASTVMFYGTLSGDIPSIFLLGIYSGLADKFGRRVALMLPAIGYLVYFGGIFAIALFKPDQYILVFCICSFFSGCCGNYGTFMMGMFAYLADITLPKERASKYSILGDNCVLSTLTAALLTVDDICVCRIDDLRMSDTGPARRRILGTVLGFRDTHVFRCTIRRSIYSLDLLHAGIASSGCAIAKHDD
jgi:MFS family permease